MMEREPQPESNNFTELMSHVLDEATFVMAEAFEQMSQNTGKAYAEYVQIDQETVPGTNLFSVLLSPTGGKPDEGVHLVRLLAYPVSTEVAEDLKLAVKVVTEGETLAFRDDEYFIEHSRPLKDGGTEVQLLKVSKNGVSGVLTPVERLEHELEIDDMPELLDMDRVVAQLLDFRPDFAAMQEPLVDDNSPSLEEEALALEIATIFSEDSGFVLVPQN